MPNRWAVVLDEGVAGYDKEERQARCRQADESRREATSSAENEDLAV
ncbi:MAG: hypothetical protein SPI30_05880 [Prevotella sp.]|nr:hypothetical protein [Prevotella sp.]